MTRLKVGGLNGALTVVALCRYVLVAFETACEVCKENQVSAASRINIVLRRVLKWPEMMQASLPQEQPSNF